MTEAEYDKAMLEARVEAARVRIEMALTRYQIKIKKWWFPHD